VMVGSGLPGCAGATRPMGETCPGLKAPA